MYKLFLTIGTLCATASLSFGGLDSSDRSHLEAWWYGCERPVMEGIVQRLEEHVQQDPADGEAAFYLSQVLRLGAGGSRVDLDRSMELLQKASDAEFPAAQARIAMHKMTGQGMPYDREGAIRLFEAAMEENEPDAFLNRGVLLLSGRQPTPVQMMTAQTDLETALELGAVRALFSLSHLAALQGDMESGRELLVQAAEAGDPQAQFYLGGSYFRARAGFPLDRDRGLEWMIKAAESGDGRWQGALANIYAEELRMGREARRWALLATERGDPTGEYIVGTDYLTGQYGEMNIEMGLRLLGSASKQGIADAQVFLARIYLEGLLVERDVEEARRLLEQAAATGHNYAGVVLRWIEFKEDHNGG